MVSVQEVNADQLIQQVSVKLKENNKIKAPAWAEYVKTGAHAERHPDNPDWFYVRCASMLRKLYIEQNVGVGKLRSWYGGRKNRGVKPEKHVDASANVIRKAFQQLEAAGLVKKDTVGRTITPKGRSLLDKTTLEVKKLPTPQRKVRQPKPATKTAVRKIEHAKAQKPKPVKEKKPKRTTKKPAQKKGGKKKK